MYATVKELHDDTVVLEVAPGVHAIYAKNAIGAVLDDAEYNRIVHGDGDDIDGAIVPDDASSLTEAAGSDEPVEADADDDSSDNAKIDLGKKAEADDVEPKDVKADEKADGEADAK